MVVLPATATPGCQRFPFFNQSEPSTTPSDQSQRRNEPLRPPLLITGMAQTHGGGWRYADGTLVNQSEQWWGWRLTNRRPGNGVIEQLMEWQRDSGAQFGSVILITRLWSDHGSCIRSPLGQVSIGLPNFKPFFFHKYSRFTKNATIWNTLH